MDGIWARVILVAPGRVGVSQRGSGPVFPTGKLIHERSGLALGWEVGYSGFKQRVVLGAPFKNVKTVHVAPTQ
jgi:hypothetical protein